MTLIASLIAVIAPALVTAFTGLFKSLPNFSTMSDATRTPAVRLIAAVLALLAVLLGEWVAGAFDSNILTVATQTVLMAFATWAASLGIFHGVFQK